MTRGAERPALEPTSAGVAFICGPQGTIQKILRDDLGPDSPFRRGAALALLVDPGSRVKLLSFLHEVRTQGAAFDWQLNVPLGGGVNTLHFAAATEDDALVAVAAASSDEILRLSDELMLVGNEQTNLLRAAIKESAERDRQQDAPHSYDELSQFNNEMARMQRELAKKNAELQQLNEQKNHFLGMAAHDLRNPLAAIFSYSEFMLETADELDPRFAKIITRIKTLSRSMAAMVDDLLDIARIEAGELHLEPAPTDLGALAGRVVELNAMLAERKQIQLHLEQPPEPLVLSIDAAKIEQVLANLLSNAIKYSFADSDVRVSILPGPDHVRVSVEDDGQGIPADKLDRMFKAFPRTSRRGTAGEASTGLGLTIVKRIVEGHGGRVGVQSAEGKGALFYFELPMGLPGEPG